MARTGKLSAVEVTKAKGPAVLHDGGGLYLRVAPPREVRGVEVPGAKSWVFRFQLDGKRRDMGLGPFPDISLADARGKAAEHRKLRHEGIDPLDAKAAQRQAQRVSDAKGRSFRESAVEFIDKNRAGWRNAKHAAQWTATLATYVYPTLGELPVSAVDAGLVVQVLDPIWAEKPETASRVRGRIEAVLDAATVRGFRQGPNPAQWKGNLAHILPARGKVRKVEHHAALPFDDMPEFLAALRDGAGRAHEGGPRASRAAVRGRARGARQRAAIGPDARWRAGPGRAGVSRPASRVAAVRDGDVDAAAPHGPQRSDVARLPLDVQRLGCRAYGIPARNGRNGIGARGREQGRGRLPAR